MSSGEPSIVDLIKKHQAQGGTLPSASDRDTAAVEHKAAAMSENIPADLKTEAALSKLLANVTGKMAWVSIDLPSKGLLYEEGTKTIHIRPFTFDEERILKSVETATKPDETIERLLEACTKGMEASKLTPHDRVYALYRIRGISYGDDYPIEHTCEKCDSRSKLELSIKSLATKPLTEDHMRFTLPDSNMDAIIKLPRYQDEHLMKTVNDMIENMHLFVYSIGDVKDKTVIEAFIRKTTVRDIDTLRSKIYNPDYGMENHFFYNCAGCGHKNRVDIMLNENFFTAS